MDDPVAIATTVTLLVLLYGDCWSVPDEYLYEIVRTDVSEPVRLVQLYRMYVCMYHLYYDPVANFRSNGRLFFTPLLKTPSPNRLQQPKTTPNRQCKSFVVKTRQQNKTKQTTFKKQNDDKVSKKIDGFALCWLL